MCILPNNPNSLLRKSFCFYKVVLIRAGSGHIQERDIANNFLPQWDVKQDKM